MPNKNKLKYSHNNNTFVTYAFDLTKTIIFVFAIISVIFTFFIRDANVVGSSMANTLHNSDKIILTNFNYTPKVGDIVAINAENMVEKRIIKRVIATEGHTISIDYDNGKVCVDGIILDEPYISSQTRKPSNAFNFPYVVPEGHVFVMGDNRNISLDSRSEKVGLVAVEEIIGKAQFIVYPFNRITYLY